MSVRRTSIPATVSRQDDAAVKWETDALAIAEKSLIHGQLDERLV